MRGGELLLQRLSWLCRQESGSAVLSGGVFLLEMLLLTLRCLSVTAGVRVLDSFLLQDIIFCPVSLLCC